MYLVSPKLQGADQMQTALTGKNGVYVGDACSVLGFQRKKC